LALGGVQQRAVLAMLALHLNEVVSTDALVDGLWGDQAPASALNIVQGYSSRLRKALKAATEVDRMGGAVLLRRGPGYLLELDPELVDLYRFQRLVREGAQALRPAPARAASILREALGLWRGQPLAEFTEQPFARAEIPRLEQQRLATLETRLEADLTLGRHAQLVGDLEALVAQHPLHEGLHRLLMLSLYRSGRQAEALEAYRRARHTLAEELGIDPGRALQELEAAMLTQDPSLDWHPPPDEPAPQISINLPNLPRSSAAIPLPQVWNVPARNPHFTGRDGMLTELRQQLGVDEPALVVQALYGLGGVGKTQLAIEYAHRFAADYDLVWWIDAEQPVLIPEQLAALAAQLDLPPAATIAATVDRLLTELRGRDRWLLIFDNANHPQDIAGFRPGGVGHVLITSRYPGWGALGGRLEVDVLTRAETIALLRARLPALGEGLADKLAAELGDLPLAAAQAAGYLEQTDLPPGDYLRRFRTRRATLLARGDVLGYSGRIDTAWALSLERLRCEDPPAVQLLELAAFLAPEPIPLTLFTGHPELLDEPLRATAADPDALADAIGALVGYSLARRHPDGFQVHRLVQAVIRQQLPPNRQQATAERVVALLAAANPGAWGDPKNWTAYTQLLPHVLATASLGDHFAASRQLVLDTSCYLHIKGDSPASRALSEQLLDRWRHELGPDHPDTLTTAGNLSTVLLVQVEAEPARTLGEDTLPRCRRVLGPDHPTTLLTALGLAQALDTLGEGKQAHTLAQDTLQRCRRVLGPDHPITLAAAAGLTLTSVSVGETQSARTLAQDTLQRCQRGLGRNHAITLLAAAGLTFALVLGGETAPARTLGQDTLQRCRRVLGDARWVTVGVAIVLAVSELQLGEVEQARALSRDTLERCRQAFGKDHLATRWAETASALIQHRLGRTEQAPSQTHDVGQSAANRSTAIVTRLPGSLGRIVATAQHDAPGEASL
jgi:DNA-binding SARP family transcriptional activator